MTKGRLSTAQVCAIEDVFARNAAITRSYYEFGQRLEQVLRCGAVSFPHWLAWGSYSFGSTMRRGIPVIGALRRLLFGRTRPSRFVREIAAGNLALYRTIGPPFEAFEQTFCEGLKDIDIDDRDPSAWEPRWEEHRSTLGRLSPTPHVELLDDGLRQYFEALFERDLVLRKQRVFFGNLLLLHLEQQSAQPFLEASVPKWARPIVAPLLGEFRLANARYPMREDVPGTYPASLQTLKLPALVEHIDRFDRNPHGTAGSGVWNWFPLGDRYQWIVESFRVHAESPEMLEEPPRLS